MTTTNFRQGPIKKRDILSPRLVVIDDNEGSQYDSDTSVIMFGRVLYHNIPWDLRYRPCLAIMRTKHS